MSGLVVAFRGTPKPTPAQKSIARKAALLATVWPNVAVYVEEVIDGFLSQKDQWAYDQRGHPMRAPRQQGSRNIGKPVIDLTGDDREGA
jgi:hypothetical protein